MIKLPANPTFEDVANIAANAGMHRDIYLSSHLISHILGKETLKGIGLVSRANIKDLVLEDGLDSIVSPGDYVLNFHSPDQQTCPYEIQDGVVEYVEFLEIWKQGNICPGRLYYSIDLEIRDVRAFEVRVFPSGKKNHDYLYKGKYYRFSFTEIDAIKRTEINIPMEFIRINRELLNLLYRK